ncbi:MAG: hypothetical protein AAF612_00430 [Planctomycetota bacterium]
MSRGHAFAADGAPHPPDRGLGPALAWGCYLGCSWTWVIGMFLPAILVRDYGWPGWALFAVPNVLGAAAMGFVLTGKASKLFVDKHRSACVTFSYTTLLLQVFALGWFADTMGARGVVVLSVGTLALLVLGLIALWRTDPTHLRHGVALAVAIGAACVSLGAMSYALKLDGAWIATDPGPDDGLSAPLANGPDLLGLAGATAFGFMLSPYLDLTFHRARIQTDKPTGRAAFAFGFGCVFLAMIIFALAYAGIVAPFWRADRGAVAPLPSAWLVLLSLHVLLQVGVTAYFHGRELLRPRPRQDAADHARRRYAAVVALLAMLFVALLAALVRRYGVQLPGYDGSLSAGEGVYRAFLLIYAVVFPSYVLIVAAPTHKPVTDAARRTTFWVVAPLAYALACASFIFGLGPLSYAAAAAVVVGRLSLDLGLVSKRTAASPAA